jgi:hypothetical protein
VDDVLRSGRLVLSAAIAAAVSYGCGAGAAAPVGVSPPRAVEPVVAADAAAEAAPVPADFRTRLSRTSDRFPSRGHADRFDAVVWANDGARAADASGGEFADGAMFVEEAIGHAVTDGGAMGLLAMEKRSGVWQFAAVGVEGEVVNDARVAACVACHREAPHDFVFVTPGQSSSAAARAATTVTAPIPVTTAATR